MSETYLPSKEGDLATWAANFNTRITGLSGPYGLLPEQVTGFTALSTAYINAYATANHSSTRNAGTIAAKNTAKQNLIKGANGIRQLVAIIQANPATTNQQREDLQITVRDVEPTPVPIPSVPPLMSILTTFGRTLKLRLRDQANPDSRGKPAGVNGASVFYAVGDAPPEDQSEWVFLRNTSRAFVEVDLPASIPAGSKVWLTAFWFNTTTESSPASLPVSFRIGDVALAA